MCLDGRVIFRPAWAAVSKEKKKREQRVLEVPSGRVLEVPSRRVLEVPSRRVLEVPSRRA